VKGIEILVLKVFGVVYVKSMVGEWCGILVIHRQYKDEKNHGYVINIHSFGPKPTCDLHLLVPLLGLESMFCVVEFNFVVENLVGKIK
jgi:hypothetical protein